MKHLSRILLCASFFLVMSISITYANNPTMRNLVSQIDETTSSIDSKVDQVQRDITHILVDNQDTVLSAVDEVESKAELILQDTDYIPSIDSKVDVVNENVLDIDNKLDVLTESHLETVAMKMSAIDEISEDLLETMSTLRDLSEDINANFSDIDAAINLVGETFSSKSDIAIGHLQGINSTLDQCCSKIDEDFAGTWTALDACCTANEVNVTKVLSAVDEVESNILSAIDEVESKAELLLENTTYIPGIDSKIDVINGKVNVIDANVDAVLEDTSDIQTRIVDVDTKVDDIHSRIPIIETQIDDAEMKILSVVDEVESKTELILEDTTYIPGIDSKVDVVDSKIDIINGNMACGSTPLDGPTIINTAGSYCLSQDCAGTFTISANNVTFDLNGHTISSGTNGIVITGDKVTVRNGTIQNMSSAGISISGDQCFIDDLTSYGNAIGFYLNGAAYASITSSHALYNSGKGFEFVNCTSAFTTECTSRYNGSSSDAYGFLVTGGSGNNFKECRSQDIYTTSLTTTAAGFMLNDTSTGNIIQQCCVTNITGNQNIYGINVEDKLPSLSRVANFDQAGEHTIHSTVWLKTDNHNYLAVGGDFQENSDDIRILDLNITTSSLNRITSFKHGSGAGHAFCLDWLQDDGKNYLAVGGHPGDDGNEVRVLEFNTTTSSLTTVASFDHGGQIYSLSWLQVGGKNYLAIGGFQSIGDGNEVRVLEFNMTTSSLTTVASFDHGGTIESLGWLQANGKNYLAIGGRQVTEVRVLEFNMTTSNLTTVASFDHGGTIKSLGWLQDDSTNYLAIGGIQAGDGYDTRVLEFDTTTSSLTTITSFKHGSVVGYVRSLSWLQDNSTNYLAIGGTDLIDDINEIRMLKFDAVTSNLTTATTFKHGNYIYSLDWLQDNSTNYLAIGGEQANDSNEARVLEFNATTPSLETIANYDEGTKFTIYSTAWFAANNRNYLAIGTDENTEQVKILDFSETSSLLLPIVTFDHSNESDSIRSLAWLETDNKNYLAIGGGQANDSNAVRVLEFNTTTSSLTTVASFDHGGSIFSVAWLEVDSKNYLAIGGGSGDGNNGVRVLEFDTTTSSLITVASFDHGGSIFSVAWLEVDSKNYLAIGGGSGYGNNEVRVLEFDTTTSSLITVASFDHGGTIESLDWLQDNGKNYLAIGGGQANDGNELRILEFDIATLSLTTVASFDNGSFDTPFSVAWLQKRGKNYLAISGIQDDGNNVRLLDFNTRTSSLTIATSFNHGALFVYALDWLQANGKNYLAIGGRQADDLNELRVLELNTNETNNVIKENLIDNVSGIGISVNCTENLLINNTTHNNITDYNPEPCSPLADLELQQSQIDACCDKVAKIQTMLPSIESNVLSTIDKVESKAELILEDTTYIPGIDSKVDSIDSKADIISDRLMSINDELSSCCENNEENFTKVLSAVDEVESKAELILEDTTYIPGIDSKVDSIDSKADIISDRLMSINDELSSCCENNEENFTKVLSAVDEVESKAELILEDTTYIPGIDSKVDYYAQCTPTPITQSNFSGEPFILNTAGQIYCLAEDVTGNITLSAADITLDLNGHLITGIINTTTAAQRATIGNGKVYMPTDTYGTRIGSLYCHLHDCIIEATNGQALLLGQTSSHAIIKNCIFIGSSGTSGTNGGEGRTAVQIQESEDHTFLATTFIGGDGGNGTDTAGSGGSGLNSNYQGSNITTLGNCVFIGGNGGNCTAGSNIGGFGGIGIDISSSGTFIIKDCNISSGYGGTSANGTGGHGGNAINIVNSANIAIKSCTINTGNGGTSTSATGGNGGVGTSISGTSSNIVIEDCEVASTGNGGSGSTSGNGGEGIYIDSNHVLISNCTIRKTGTGNRDGYGIFLTTTASDIIIRDCLVEKTGYAIVDAHTADDSLIFSNYAYKTQGYSVVDTLTGAAIDWGNTPPGTPFGSGTDRLSNIYRNNI